MITAGVGHPIYDDDHPGQQFVGWWDYEALRQHPDVMLGEGVIFGYPLKVQVRRRLAIGSTTTIGPDTTLIGNSIVIGRECFGWGGLDVGGGGGYGHQSNLTIGNRCVFHNNHINLAAPVTVGDFVGLSPNVDLITHGYWQNPLLGYPQEEAPIVIESGVIIGRGSMVLPGVTIGENSVIGAMSVVTRDIPESVVAAGNPCKVLKPIARPPEEKQIAMIQSIMKDYQERAAFFNVLIRWTLDFPIVHFRGHWFDLLSDYRYEINPDDQLIGEDFRNFIRRKGIWLHGARYRTLGDQQWTNIAQQDAVELLAAP